MKYFPWQALGKICTYLGRRNFGRRIDLKIVATLSTDGQCSSAAVPTNTWGSGQTGNLVWMRPGGMVWWDCLCLQNYGLWDRIPPGYRVAAFTQKMMPNSLLCSPGRQLQPR
jgi:hypothetical protein